MEMNTAPYVAVNGACSKLWILASGISDANHIRIIILTCVSRRVQAAETVQVRSVQMDQGENQSSACHCVFNLS